MTTRLRAEMEEELKAKGITGLAMLSVMEVMTRTRHAIRVAEVCRIAEQAGIDAVFVPDSVPDTITYETKQARAIGLCLLDLVGVPDQSRIPAFASLGTGRKQGKDGTEWTTAIAAAAIRMATRIGYFEPQSPSVANIVLKPIHNTDDTTPVTGLGVLVPATGKYEPVPYPLNPNSERMYKWHILTAREGLHRSLGLLSWRPEVNFYAAGNPADWSALVNWLYATNHANNILQKKSWDLIEPPRASARER